MTKKTQMQNDKILAFMEEEKEYGIRDFCELLGLKESRTKDILKGLSDYKVPFILNEFIQYEER